MAPPPPALAAIVGPTGSGKTDLSLAVADSRQVYRGMDIGTAKPDAKARAAVPHHLLDLVEPGEPFSVAAWAAQGRRVAGEVAGRGHLPLLVGGSGLYLTAVLDGYAFGPAPSPDVRARLRAELEHRGLEPLVERLRARDPATAAVIDLRNPRRVERALERLSAGGAGAAEPAAGRVRLIGIQRPTAVLNHRIDERAAWLFGNGLLEEVRILLDAGHDPRRAPLTGHGYGEAARYLAGEWSLEEAVATTARRTRQYAKRQRTWFRRDPRILWLAAGDGPADDSVLVAEATRLLDELRPPPASSP
jgi:tRNA dimethylallyltransferase